jgi:hypothetical protein
LEARSHKKTARIDLAVLMCYSDAARLRRRRQELGEAFF